MTQINVEDLYPTMEWPEEMPRKDGFWKASDDTDIFWQHFKNDESKASIALMHGYGEHSTRYNHVASALVRAGFDVMAIDARGHGKSAGIRGHVLAYDDYVRDMDMLVKKLAEESERPIFCLGHSNGGLITLRHALQNKNPRIKGYMVTSPFCGFKVHVPLPKAVLGKAMSRVWPSLAIPTELDAAVLSHRQEVVDTYRKDPLVLSKATARWFTETKAAQADLRARARQIEKPVIFLVAGADALADPHDAEAIYHECGTHDRHFEAFPELFHEILNEDSWPEHVQTLVDWMEERLT